MSVPHTISVHFGYVFSVPSMAPRTDIYKKHASFFLSSL